MQSFLSVLSMPKKSCLRRGAFQGACALAALVIVWGSVLMPTQRATAHAAATEVGITIGGACISTDMDPSAQQHTAKRSEEALQRAWRKVQGHETERHRATRLLGRLGDRRAIEPILEQWRGGHVVEEKNHALEPWGADHEALVQTHIVAAQKRRQAAVVSLEARGDKRTMASVITALHEEGAFGTALSDSNHLLEYLHEANATVRTLDTALEEKLQMNLNIIQWHDPYDAVLRSAIAFIGHVGDKRVIDPLIEAWSKRTERQLEAIQRVVEKLQIKDRSDRNNAWLVEQVIDQILDDINTALESLGIERERLLHFNREAVNKGGDKAIHILVKYGDTDAIPLLLELLKKGNNNVRHYNEALEKLGAEKEGIFKANLKALEGWNRQATLTILGTFGDRRAIGPIRHLLEMPEPVHTEAKAVLKQLGASWYDQRSDAERLGLWLGALITCRALWRGGKMLWHPLRRSLPPYRG